MIVQNHKKVPIDELYLEIKERLYKARNPAIAMQRLIQDGYVESFWGHTIAIDDEAKKSLRAFVEQLLQRSPYKKKNVEIILFIIALVTPVIFFLAEKEMNITNLCCAYICLVVIYFCKLWKPKKQTYYIYLSIAIAIALSVMFFLDQKTLLMINALYGCYMGIYISYLAQRRFKNKMRIIVLNACKTE